MNRLCALVACLCLAVCTSAQTVEQWGTFELSLAGPAGGNPFLDVSLNATFASGDTTMTVRGFYDGQATYRVRFMPTQQGIWRYQTQSSSPELDGKAGEFTCVKPAPGNRGPMRVHNTYHFAFADGTTFKPIGTTCYGWTSQTPQLQDQTLATLTTSPFNKIRMCVLPTRTTTDEPFLHPFETAADGARDYTRLNPAFFQSLDKRVAQLRDVNIEADIILFHPYGGQQGYARMDAATDDRYLRYVIARLGAYRNVWWSMANEFDLLRTKTDSDWDRLFGIIQADDPHNHLRSIHHSRRYYDQSKPWITHLSVQNGSAVAAMGRAPIYRQLGRKPVMFDEVCYEGNIDRRWGNLTAEQMVLRFWIGSIGGTYVTHGESLVEQGQPSWLGQGGILRGQSPQRIAFLKKVLDSAPKDGIDPIDQYFESHLAGKAGEYYLIYFGEQKPTDWTFELYREGLAEGMRFHVDVLDTWNMTIKPIESPVTLVRHNQYMFRAKGDVKVPLGGKPYMAVRIERLAGPTTATQPGPTED
jgi:hypothetical protein